MTAASMAVLNQLYAAMRLVLADGKSLYRGVDSVKVKGYTLRELLKRVRLEQGKDE